MSRLLNPYLRQVPVRGIGYIFEMTKLDTMLVCTCYWERCYWQATTAFSKISVLIM